MCLAEMLSSSNLVHVIAHSDLDGIVSAAIAVRWARGRGIDAAWEVVGLRSLYGILVSRMREALSKPYTTVFLVLDMAPRHSDAYVYASLIKRGRVELAWVDHHEWPIELISFLEKAGAKIFIDKSDVTAANLHRILNYSDPVVDKLVEIARLDDACKPDPHGIVSKWRILLRSLPPSEANRVIDEFSRGVLWPKWADEAYNRVAGEYMEQLRSTHVSLYVFNDIRVEIATPPPMVSACDLELAGFVGAGVRADITVIVYPRSLSIRTSGRFNADCIARRLGGGGHRRAAGAPRPGPGMGPAQIARIIARYAEECVEAG